VEENCKEVLQILDNINEILSGEKDPPELNISYYVYDFLLDGIIAKGLNVQSTLPKLLQLIDPRVMLPQKISNLTRKVKDYIKKGNDKLAQISSIHVDPRLNLPKVFQAHGIAYEHIISKSIPELKEPIALSVGDVVYLRGILHSKNLPWSHATYWLNALMFVDLGKQVSSVEKVLRHQWDQLYTKMRKLTISRNYDMLEKLLKEHYIKPTNHQQSPRTQSTTEHKVTNLENEIEKQHNQMVKFRKELVRTYTTVVDLTEEVNELVLENMEYEKKTRKCEKIQNEIKQKCKEINDLKQKLAIYNSRNVNKKIKRRDEKVKLLSQKIEENNETHSNRINFILRENNELEKELNEMNEKVKSMHSNWYRDKKMKSYYKTKMVSHAQQEQLHKDQNTKNEKIITDLQNQVNDLERSQEEDITKLELFNQGKYKDEVRQVYMDLHSN